jgi:hypothetical protein
MIVLKMIDLCIATVAVARVARNAPRLCLETSRNVQ